MKKAKAKEIYIVAHSSGGHVTVHVVCSLGSMYSVSLSLLIHAFFVLV